MLIIIFIRVNVRSQILTKFVTTENVQLRRTQHTDSTPIIAHVFGSVLSRVGSVVQPSVPATRLRHFIYLLSKQILSVGWARLSEMRMPCK